MSSLLRSCLVVGVAAASVLVVSSPASAGSGARLAVDVTGTAECLSTGEAQLTWVAVVDEVAPSTTIELDSLQGGTGQAIVQFVGEMSGAASGAVTFDPYEQTILATFESFPVDSQAVATAPGTVGGTAVLDVTVRVYNPENPDEDVFVVEGSGSVEVPVCEHLVVTEATTAPVATAAAAVAPRFTG